MTNKKITNIILPIFILFFFIGLIFSYILIQEYYFRNIMQTNSAGNNIFSEFSKSFCGENTSVFSCNNVAKSSYSLFLNVPIAIIGFFYFSFVILLTMGMIFFENKIKNLFQQFLLLLLINAFFYNIFLIIVSIFIIKSICPLCIVTYIVNWVTLGLAVYLFKKEKVDIISLENIKSFLQESIYSKVQYLFFIIVIFSISIAVTFWADNVVAGEKDRYSDEIRDQKINEIVESVVQGEFFDIDVSEELIFGDKNALVSIVEFSDFLCPFCSKTSALLDQIVKEKKDKVKLYFINYPLDIECNPKMRRQLHPGACLLAKGSICSGKQSKFHEFQVQAFNMKNKLINKSALSGIASRIGLNLPAFSKCLASDSTKAELQSQMEITQKLGINGTPTIFINGKRYRYKLIKLIVEKIIDKEYELLNK